MKKLLIFLFMLFILPIVYSAQLYSGTVTEGELFKAGDYDCMVDYSPGNAKLIFEIDGLRRILDEGDCFSEDDFKACFDDVSVDDLGYATSISVSVYSLGPSISIERTISDTTVGVGDVIEVEAVINNDGEKPAYNVIYKDSFPSQLRLTSGSIEGNSVVWEGKLNSGISEKIRYKLEAMGVVTYDSKASLSYQYESQTKKLFSSEEPITVSPPYGFSTEISTQSPRQNEVIIFTVNIDNKAPGSLRIDNLMLEPSAQVEIANKFDFKQEGNKLYYSGNLYAGEIGTWKVYLKSSRVGQHSIKVIADIKLGTTSFKEEYTEKFGIGVSDIYASINLLPDVVKSGDDIRLKVSLKNSGDKDISSIGTKIESGLFDAIESTGDNILSGATKEITTKTIVAPNVNEDTMYQINVRGSYQSGGQYFSFTSSDEVKVQPKEKVVEILYQLNKDEFNLGERVEVDVFAVNLKGSGMEQASLIEMLPNEVKDTLEGDILFDGDIGANQKIKVYSYNFIVPEDYGKSNLELKTVFNAKVSGSLYKLQASKQLTILGVVEKDEVDTALSITEGAVDQPIDNLSDMGEEKEKISFFAKIINFFKGLFTRSQPVEQE